MFEPIAFTGQEGIDWGLGPGLPSGEPFRTIGAGVLNDRGEAAFGVFLNSNLGGEDEGVWKSVPGLSNRPVFREGVEDPGPQLGDGYFFLPNLREFGLGGDGAVGYAGPIRGPGIGPSPAYGLWINDGGAVSPVAVDDFGAFGPGPGSAFGNLSATSPRMNDRGDVAFRTGGPFNDPEGVWTWRGGSLSEVFRPEKSLTSYGLAGGVIDRVGDPTIDASGRVTVALTAADGDRIYTYDSGAYELVAGAHAQAADASPGARFTTLDVPSSNQAGDLAFRGRVTGFDGSSDERAGIWWHNNGAYTPVAVSGSGAFGPGLGDGYEFTGLGAPHVSPSGAILFDGRVSGPGLPSSGATGEWVWRDGVVHPIALEDTELFGPGLGPGVIFSDVGSPAVANDGTAIFSARVSGPGFNTGNNRSLWLWDDGVLTELVRIGQDFDVDPSPLIDDFREIRQIGFVGHEYDVFGSATGLNSQGELLVRFGFGFNSNSSGLYRVTIVPEPSALVLMAALAMASGYRRR